MKYENLLYRRQFILVPEKVKWQHNWVHTPLLNQYQLYSHPDLNLSRMCKNEKELVLLGDLFDYRNNSLNDDIIESLFVLSFEDLLKELEFKIGRYVILYITNNDFFIVNDPASSRKVYYSLTGGKRVYIASQPHVLARILNLSKSEDKFITQYYESIEFVEADYSGIGNYTAYDNIKQLTANFHLDCNKGKIRRFWPNKRIEQNRNIDVVAKEAANMLKGFISAIAKRYEIMIPVTAGIDSRTILAASKEISNKTYYYVNKHSRLDSIDVNVPTKLFNKLGYDFHKHSIEQEVPEEFKNIYLQNNEYANLSLIKVIYYYYKNFEFKLNLPGTFGSIVKYKIGTPITSGDSLVKEKKMENIELAHIYFNNWYNEVEPLSKEFSIGLSNLFHWEDRMANWNSQYQVDKDIAQEEIILFNSRRLIEIMISTDKRHRIKPSYELWRRICSILWREVLSEPINPSLNNTILNSLHFINLDSIVLKIKKNWT